MLLHLFVLTWIALLTILWRYLTKVNRFWAERGVPHLTPLYPLIGNSWMFLKKKGLIDLMDSVISMYPGAPLLGVFNFTAPHLIVKDLGLVEHVLIKDFHHFADRGFPVDAKRRPFDVNLFTMTGKKWKICRNKFSPMFTTSKVRSMLPQMEDLAKQLISVIEARVEGLELKETFFQYAIDVVASTAFGMDTGTIKETKESELRKMIRKAHMLTPGILFSFLLYSILPQIAHKLSLGFHSKDVAQYFSNIVKEALHLRRNSYHKRNDFLQLMVTLQQKGRLEIEVDESDAYLNIDYEDKKVEHLELTDDLMIGQAALFLLVGLDGTSSTLMYLCYELAMHPEIQDKVRSEVIQAVQSSGALNYDAVKEMNYLDQCLKETLRLHSPAELLIRVSTREYTFPGTDVTIPPGTQVVIPVVSIHMDGELYPEPERFDPERFAPEMCHPPCSYLPFGDGPRMCIAMKFAITEMKCVAAKLLMKYKLGMNAATSVPLKHHEPNIRLGSTSPNRRKILFNLSPITNTNE